MNSYRGACLAVLLSNVGFEGTGERGGRIAQVSTTWVPWVLMTFMVCPSFNGTATPKRAGMVCVTPVSYLDFGRVVMVWCCCCSRGPGCSRMARFIRFAAMFYTDAVSHICVWVSVQIRCMMYPTVASVLLELYKSVPISMQV